MFNFEKIHLTFSFSPLFFFAALLILGAYTVYVYRYTVPVVSITKKILLVALRTLALLLLLFVIFEPILTLTKKIVLEPVNLIFVDNSRSMQIRDGTHREESIDNFLKEANSNNLFSNSKLYSFGNEIKPVDTDSLSKINFSEGSTNFSKIFSNVKEDKSNVSSVVIISDGVITDGTNPLYTAEKLNIPVFTVGVGDTTKHKDIEIKNVLYNEYIYAQTPTTIQGTILNNGFGNQSANVTFYENDLLVEQKTIKLSADGVQNVNFTYTPQTGGEKKLTMEISNLKGEFTAANNKKIFYINVLSNKIKVLLVSGAPSPDLEFIKNTLTEDKNLSVNSITQIAQNNFLEKNNKDELIDSSQILFLIGFPTGETPNELLSKVYDAINNKSRPFFITLSGRTDFSRLKQLHSELPFIASNPSSGFTEVQPNISVSESDNPLIQNNSQNPIEAWNNLPPIYQPQANYKAKPEDEIISTVKINNVPINSPLIVSRILGSKRSIAVLAKDIWKWKLQTADDNLNLFDNFILNSIKWLNTSSKQKQVTIKTSKKNYSSGEKIDFTGQVYDETFNPVSDAEVKVKVNADKENYNLTLSAVGNGLYEGSLQITRAGNYRYSGEAIQNGKKLGSDAGKFNIGEVDIEMINPQMNYSFLSSLAKETGGKFFNTSDDNQLFSIIKNLNKRASKEKTIVSEIKLWSNEWLMAIAILFFALEWFFRKRAGML
ncbi:MAG: CARDB domain-containing protein [Ignavibacteriaceae bacterium]